MKLIGHPPRTPLQQARMCNEFNRKYPVGTLVRVFKVLDDESTAFETKTSTPASILHGHTAVVWLEGVSGCYGLEYVKPISDPVILKEGAV